MTQHDFGTAPIPAGGRAAQRARSALRVAPLVAVIFAVGCATTPPRGLHEIPTTRDYADLPATTIDEAVDAVDAARRAGAAGFAPHAYGSAENFLLLAVRADSRRDTLGAQDYATLAVRHAQKALNASSAVAAPAGADIPPNEAATRQALAALTEDWRSLDHARAAEALPFLFADLTTALSQIEHDLNRGAWEAAAARVPGAAIMMTTLRTRDMDGDGIPDIADPDPRRPEEEIVPPPPPPALDSIRFGSGSVMIDTEAKGYLRGLIPFLADNPEWRLHIKGHTDDRHSASYSLELSRRRAEAVQRHLIGAGAPAQRLIVSYYGAARPVEPSPAGVPNAANRRVELQLEHIPRLP